MKVVCLNPAYSTTRLLTTERQRFWDSHREAVGPNLHLPVSKNRKNEGGLRSEAYCKQGYIKNGDQWYACDTLRKEVEPVNLSIEVGGSVLPLITVVTVVFNGELHIEKTIESVINQTYSNVEYIIIDGGSTDGTLEIIDKYENEIDYWISEKDDGIYDAMNKAIELATGSWINFMNAGDIFYSRDTLETLFNADSWNNDDDIVYGNVHIRYPDFTRVEKAGKLSRLWSGMQFCHQSAIVKTSYHKSRKFNSRNRIAADLEFFYSSYKNGARFRFEEIIMSSVSTGGLSESNRIKTIMSSRDAVCNSGCRRSVILFYMLLVIDVMFRGLLKKILPVRITNKIIQMKS
ncbi:glycosyltransferase family 2 protein [Rhodoferax ferrireducens]|uniref:glycosyltransferase family 2 protein n=1 Tax=Rhodoferax ferrireducens TaxID=192843 RepID=UPI00298EC594|nr:glycosyltransferase family 2 protein [Rhodoferax ferrireducens]WPC68123.1 glycosyltransferase family 2 protein [Rhodoferax ferrireducens]